VETVPMKVEVFTPDTSAAGSGALHDGERAAGARLGHGGQREAREERDSVASAARWRAGRIERLMMISLSSSVRYVGRKNSRLRA
jgi:hypothetical protein